MFLIKPTTMKKSLNLIFILITLTVFSQTQNPNLEWEQTYGGSSSDILYSTITTSDGGYLLGGGTSSNDGDIQSGNHGSSDFWGVKIDSEGTIEWEQTYGGSDSESIRSTTSTPDGGYLLGGYSNSNDGDIQSGNHGSSDFWVVKIDSVGTIEWEQTYGGSLFEGVYSIITTPDGGYLLGGNSNSNDGDIQSGNHGSSDFWVVKIDSVGTIEWEQTYGGSESEYIKSTNLTNDGGYLLGGWSQSTDGDIQSGNHGLYDYWVVKINSEGTIEWEQTYGGSDMDYLTTTIPTSDGGYLLGGWSQSTDGDIQSGNHGGRDFWVVKIDSEGTIEWEQTYGGSSEEILNSNLPTLDGGYLFGGSTLSNDGDIQSGNQGGDGDFWVVKIDSEGTIEWEQTYGGSESEYIKSTNLTNDGGYLLGGTTTSNDGDIQSGNHGLYEYWVVKINPDDIYITDITYGEPYCLDDTIGSIEIEVGNYTPPLSFLWSSGQTTQNIYNVSSGIYSVTITDSEGMELTEQFNLVPQPIYEGTNLCYLTTDGSFNLVYIDKGLDNYNTDKYIIYREGSIVGVYDYIGEINSDENYFTDTTINNNSRSYSYKVSMMDKCGNETNISTSHSTIHLSINSGTNNEVNLYWSQYMGLTTPTYSIYRRYLNEEFVLLEEISSNNNTYTDFPPEQNSLYEYYISFNVETTCDTIINTKFNDFISIKSNYVSLGGTGLLSEFYNEKVKTYPNPVKDMLFVNLENLELNVDKILLFNSTGKLVFSSEGTELKSKIIEISVLKYNTGLYNLNLYTKQGVLQRKIVIVR